MVRPGQRSGCAFSIAVLLIFFGILQLVLSVNPNTAVSFVSSPQQSVQPTCNGQPMSPGDVCDVYENGVLVHTDTYEERFAAANPPNYLVPFVVTLTQPSAHIYGWLVFGIGLLILIILYIQKARAKRQERLRIL